MLAQRLYELDKSSTRFPEQLDALLHDNEWVTHLQLLPEGELMELITYLNDVRLISTTRSPTHCPYRFSTASIAWTRASGSASTCCRKSAARGRLFPQPTKCLTDSQSTPRRRSHTADSVMSTKDPWGWQMFVSNGSEYPPQAIG